MEASRRRRMRLFENTFQITEETRVLDVGGSTEIWQYAHVQPSLTIANLPTALVRTSGAIAQVGADGCMLPFRDKTFDIVFSNSVVEHVGGVERQRAFAREVARVGRQFWVQTPAQSFPVEQHLLVPFVPQLPKKWRAAIVNRITGWEILTRPTEAQRRYYIGHCLNEMRLLGSVELRDLFPGCRVIRERFCGFTKSLIALRADDAVSEAEG